MEGCKALFDDLLMEVKREYDELEKRKSKKMLKAKIRAEYVTLSSRSDLLQHKKRKSALGALERSFNTTEREEADKDCAKMFYTGALSFNFVKNPYFRRFCLRLANNSLVGYSPPTYNSLRTTLLVQEKTHVQRLIQPIKDTWKRK